MITKKEENKATLLAVLGYTIFGFSLIFSRSALNMTTPFVLLAVRFLAAFALLNLLMLFKPFKLRLKGKNVLPLLFLGLVQPIIYFLCENFAVEFLSTSIIGVILSLCPVTSIIFGFVFLKERVSLKRIIAIIVSVLGVVLIALQDKDDGNSHIIGFILAFGAVLAASAFNILSRKIKDGFSAYEKTYVMFAMGSVAFTAIALISSIGNYQELIFTPLVSYEFWIDIIYLAGASSVGAFFFINYSYGKLPIARVTVFNSLTTVFSVLAGVIFLKEDFGVLQIIGAVLVILAVIAAGILNGKEKLEDEVADSKKDNQ